AKFMREVVIDGKDPNEVRKKVVEFRRGFLEVKYTFKVDLDSLSSVKLPLII
ncbi:MAG: serine hydroxymethyltransferase, partial [Sulfolobales archaeon]